MSEKCFTIRETIQRLNLRPRDAGIVKSLISRGKLAVSNECGKKKIPEKSIVQMLAGMREEQTYDEIISELLRLHALFQKNKLQIPFFLKGTIGECLTMKALISQESLKNSAILYLGGTTPKEDIIVDGKKIQVKTQFPHDYEIVKNVKCFSSPTIRKSTFSFVDFIVLVIVPPAGIFSSEYYIFGKEDFDYFNTIGCWSGKSKGDKTIFCIEEINGPLSSSAKDIIGQYDKDEYKQLFKNSRGEWKKIKSNTQ